jgi:hypothetical protein
MSMLTAFLFDFIFYWFKQVGKNAEHPLVDTPLLIVGDHAQLPAICHHRTDPDVDPVCLKCHLTAFVNWPL